MASCGPRHCSSPVDGLAVAPARWVVMGSPRKPAQIRLIYAQLRRMMGDEVPAGDLIRIAHLFLRAYSDAPLDELKEFGVAGESRALHTLAVDEAMSDGGWQVLAFEHTRAGGSRALELLDVCYLDSLLIRFLGSEWRHHRLTGQL